MNVVICVHPYLLKVDLMAYPMLGTPMSLATVPSSSGSTVGKTLAERVAGLESRRRAMSFSFRPLEL